MDALDIQTCPIVRQCSAIVRLSQYIQCDLPVVDFVCFLASFYRPLTRLRKGNVFTSVCHSVYRGEGDPIPFRRGVWVGIPFPPPTKVHGTRDPLHPLEGTWDQRYPTPRNHKSGRYVSYWIAFLFLLFATVPVAAWSNIRKTLTIRAINSRRFQELNIPNKFLKLHVVYLYYNFQMSLLLTCSCDLLRKNTSWVWDDDCRQFFFRKNHDDSITLQLNHLSFPKYLNKKKTNLKQMQFLQTKYPKTKMKTKRHYNGYFLILLSFDNGKKIRWP